MQVISRNASSSAKQRQAVPASFQPTSKSNRNPAAMVLQIVKNNLLSHSFPLLQDTEVGLFRSDYFFCCANECTKQVEFNTIASSFGCTTSKLVQAHKYRKYFYLPVQILFINIFGVAVARFNL